MHHSAAFHKPVVVLPQYNYFVLLDCIIGSLYVTEILLLYKCAFGKAYSMPGEINMYVDSCILRRS